MVRMAAMTTRPIRAMGRGTRLLAEIKDRGSEITAAKLYSITSNTKAVISGLTEDMTIYWIVQAD